MDDVGVVEGADDLGDGVGLADIREELVTQTFTLGCAANDTGDIDEGDSRGQDALGTVDFRRARRSSGRLTTPTLGSMVAKG